MPEREKENILLSRKVKGCEQASDGRTGARALRMLRATPLELADVAGTSVPALHANPNLMRGALQKWAEGLVPDQVLTEFSGLVSERNGKPVLAMKWLLKGDVYALGYLLSTVSVAHKNASDGHKAEKFLEEGLRLVRANLSPTETVSGSLASSIERMKWRPGD